MTRYTVADIDAPVLRSIQADQTIAEALDRMFETGCPQLGVTRDGELTGIISHRDITRVLHLSSQINQDGAILEKSVIMAVNRSYERVSPKDGLFELFDELADAPYVIISDDETRKILRDVGLHQFLQDEIKEFLLIEEIERIIRDIIRDTIGDALPNELGETFSPLDVRTPGRLEECSFRHYSIFISDQWNAFDSQFEHKQDFVRELIDRVGEIRNQMFHFRDLDDRETYDSDFIEFAREHLAYIYNERVEH